MIEAGFLKTLREDPADDTTRLVYADWIEEQGDPARAEFIRSQLRLETMGEDDPERPALEARERALLEAQEPSWVGPVPECVGDWKFRGGFIDEVVIRGQGKLEAAAELFARHPIRKVFLAQGRDLEEVARWEPLRGVSVLAIQQAGQPGDQRGLEVLLHSPHARQVSSLTLSGFASSPDSVRLLARAPLHLRALQLQQTQVQEAVLASLLGGRALEGLEELFITTGTRWSGQSLEAIIARPSRWRRLQLPFSCDQHTLARLAPSCNLRRLSLDGAVSGSLVLPPWPKLEELGLGQGNFHAPLPDTSRAVGLRKVSLRLFCVDDESSQHALLLLLARLPGPILDLTIQVVNDHRGRPWAKAVWNIHRLAGLAVENARSLGGLDEGVDLSGLRELKLSFDDEASPAELARLLGSPRLGRLRHLHLAGLQRGVAGVMRVLVASPYLSRLRELTLGGRLDQDCVRLLADWPGLARLDRLMLAGAPGGPPGEDVLTALSDSPHLSRLTRLTTTGIAFTGSCQRRLQDRLGRRALLWPPGP